MPLLQGRGWGGGPEHGLGAVGSTRPERSWHRSPDLTRELQGKREGASCGLGKNSCWEPPSVLGSMSGQSPLEPQKQPMLGSLEEGHRDPSVRVVSREQRGNKEVDWLVSPRDIPAGQTLEGSRQSGQYLLV